MKFKMSILTIMLFFQHSNALFYTNANNNKKMNHDDIIFESSDVPSAISCSQKCHYLDKQSSMAFHQDVCKCIKRGDEGADGDYDVPGLYLEPIEVIREEDLVRKSSLKNIALNKTSIQSSTYDDLDKNAAYKANDGNLKTRSATGFQMDPWWEVDLERSITIKLIRLHLHQWAFDHDRYKGLNITTRNSKTGNWVNCDYIEKVMGLLVETNCAAETTARYVNISVKINENLYFSEVEIFE